MGCVVQRCKSASEAPEITRVEAYEVRLETHLRNEWKSEGCLMNTDEQVCNKLVDFWICEYKGIVHGK